MTYTLQQFGQAVKKKYPQLASKKDEEVAQMVLAQYPEYRSWVDGAASIGTLATDNPQMINPQLGSVNASNFNTPSAPPQPSQSGAMNVGASGAFSPVSEITPQKGPLGKIGDFIGQTTGIKGTGDALNTPTKALNEQNAITDIGNNANDLVNQAGKYPVGDPRRRALIAQAIALNQGASGLSDQSLNSIPTNLQGLASVGKVGLTIASLGVGSGLSGAAAVGSAGLQGIAAGGLDAAEKGLTGTDIAKAAAIGGVTGLAVGALVEGIKQGAQRWAQSNYEKGARFTPSQLKDQNIKDAIAYGTKQGKVFKNAKDAVDFFDQQSSSLEDSIQGNLTSTPGKIRPKVIVDKIAESMNKEGYVTSPDAVFGKLVDSVPNGERLLTKTSLSLSDANQLKRAISDNINWKPGTWFATLKPGTQKLLLNARYMFSEAVKNAAPEGTRELFKKQMYSIILRDGFQAAVDQGVKGGGLLNSAAGGVIAGGLGLGAGVGTGGIATVAGAALTKGLHTTAGRTLAAYGLSHLLPAIMKLAPVEQQMIIQAIENAYGPKGKTVPQ